MALLIEWGITLHNRMSLCLLVARVALAPSRRIPTCLTYLTCRTYRTCRTCRTCRTFRTYRTCRTCRTYLTSLTYHFNKTVPHWRVHHSLRPNISRLARHRRC
jgi:hypothetical protein